MNYIFSKLAFKALLIFSVLSLLTGNLFAQDGTLVDPTNSQTRQSSAALEVYSTNQGFLTPRIALTGTTDATTVTGTEPNGLLVYNTATAGGVTPGFYYWNGTTWQRLINGNGNFPTGSGTLNYVTKWTPDGTTLGSSQLFDNGTNVGLGTTVPNDKLDVIGNVNAVHLEQGPLVVRPKATWSVAGGSTGAVIIKLPGTTANYGMLHMEINVYEYGSTAATTYIIGGHNWNGQWYNYNCQTIGTSTKKIRLAVKDNQYAIVIGETGSTWSYGHVVLSKITNGGYYSGIIDLGGTYTVYQDNAAESYTWITSDINSATNPSISTNYIQNQNTSAQAANYWINGTANSQGGYTSTSNPWGTSNSAFFPNGITTAASTNWIYGTTNYIGNAPSNGFGHQFNATSGNSSAWLAIGGGNVGVGTTSPGWKLDVTGNARIGANTAQNTLAALAVSAGQGTATTYRDIDLHGSWSANEGHAITASHASGASNIVGQIVFEHNSPGSRIKFGRLYHSGDQTTYPMELVSNGSNAILRMNNDAYDYFGPNSSWGAYLQVGGNGRVTTGASVAATNGNLHIDAADGGFATYVNYYSQNPTYINAQAGNIGLGTTATFDKVTVNGRIRFGTNDVSYTNPGAGATFGTGDPTQGIGWGNQPLDEYGIWVAPQENLYGNYTRLIIGWHTGVKIGASSSYGGTRFYNNSPVYAGSSATEIMSIGNGDNHVRVANYLFAQYVNTSDNVVGSGVSGIMVKAGDNYMRTGNAASVLSYLGVTAPTGDNLGNHTATTTLNMNGSAITNSANVYTSGWFRNTTNLNGLYNEAVGAHFYASAAHIWNMGGGGTYPQLIFRDNHQSTIRGYVYSDGSGFGLLHSSGGWAIRTQPGLQELYDDTYMNRARPYITYDRDDASYYTDLNTWSRMWGVGTFYVRNNYAESTDHPFGVYFANGMSTDYAIFRESGAWNFPYPDLRIAFHTGIKLGAHWTYGGTRFYNNSDMATLIFSVGDGDNYTRVTSNGGSDGIAMGQIHGDNTNTIQTYIDGQWANRASYAGGCCNPLLLQPDVGVVAIGTASANLGYKLHVNGNVLCTTLRSNGFIEPSDARLKVNIKPLEGALSKVMAMQGVTYNWNKELEQNKPLTDKLQYGLIAQELEKIIPELINTDEDGWKGIEYSHLVPVLIEALKEQQQTIETQKQLITGNTDDITFLKNYTKELEAKINTIAADKTSTGNK